ncbi:hypothetical protein CYY_006948 [Polysphondylium violaceum]|uniref:Spermatogenesis-associated protein 20-like TRX domain-containing protein n=1 Tax=Polysphondylium violaceum TaxID=133409 RepID=A0A8J4UYC8_9MYCE|nr:hypothetical protein CYY_006948 [Polysphondylium violaceum]
MSDKTTTTHTTSTSTTGTDNNNQKESTNTTTAKNIDNKEQPQQQHEYTNKLIHEKSPYLLQHAHNPVDWYPWGQEAFEKAKQEDKCIFLSIGYYSCHWCHVMAHECFEDPEIAKVMNELFINVKIDREERPDIDKIYMTYITEVTGSGGWPLSVWLTPDLEPITGGTYFAPTSKYGRPGFPDLCKKLESMWKNKREMVLERSNTFIEFLKEKRPAGNATSAISEKTIDLCYHKIMEGYDSELGGFTDAPKFPRTGIFNFLHQVHNQRPEGLKALHFTLTKMAFGGMYDQLGGGFHRYSVTPDWKVPHFEKMLYDQGQIASVYLDAYQITKNPLFAEIARGILDYVQRDLTHPDGGFFCAEDADSLDVESGHNGEGTFYVWLSSEIEEAINDQEKYNIFSFMYGILDNGNVDPSDDPHNEFIDKNIIMKIKTSQECANYFKMTVDEIDQHIAICKQRLFAAREKRPRPPLDDKIITSWNALMISAYAKAYQIFGEKSYLDSAVKAVDFIKKNLYMADKGLLIRNYRHGPSSIQGFCDDYSFLIQGLLDLYEASFNTDYLEWAVKLQEMQDTLFYDTQDKGYFSTSGQDKTILSRLKEDHDGAEPSCQSVSSSNLLRLYAITEDQDLYERKAKETFEASALYLDKAPIVLPQMVCSLNMYLKSMTKFIIATPSFENDDFKNLVTEIHSNYIPLKVLIVRVGTNGDDHAKNDNADRFFKEKTKNFTYEIAKPIYDKPTMYMCNSLGCQPPTYQIDDIKQRLEKLSKNIE